MNTTNSELHRIVMRRVYTIHALRTYALGASGALVVLAGSLYVIGREVWFARIVENMPRLADVPAVLRFFSNAFLSTEHIVQALVILTVFATLWLVRELSKLVIVPFVRFA